MNRIQHVDLQKYFVSDVVAIIRNTLDETYMADVNGFLVEWVAPIGCGECVVDRDPQVLYVQSDYVC